METIAKLIEDHPELVEDLEAFSFPHTAKMIATLSLCPELLANTMRIELLQHLVAVSCKGNVNPQREDLARWANTMLVKSTLARLEDPVEDVFVDYTSSIFGGFRVFPGILSDAAFWAERLLKFLGDKQDFPPFRSTVSHAICLLKIGEELANRLDLARYSTGGGMPGDKIEVPEWSALSAKMRAVHFSRGDLANLGIGYETLREFLFTSGLILSLPGETLWNSSLERHPLVEVDDGILVAVPSFLIRAVIRFLLEQIYNGIGGWGDTFFQVESASVFINTIRRRLDINPLDFEKPVAPDKLPPMLPYFGYFDFGKPVIMLTHCVDLSKSATDFNGVDDFTEGQEIALDVFLRACASKFEKVPGFSGGLILVCLVSIGRSYSFGIRRIPNWHIHVASLVDWSILTTDPDCTAMRLWKLSEHEAVLEADKTNSINLSGLLNLYAYWQGNGFRLIPKTTDKRSLRLLYFDATFAANLRIQTKQRKDAHCVQSHDSKNWVKLARRNTDSLFVEHEGIRMYADYDAVENGQLVGCVPQGNKLWWITAPSRQAKSEATNLIFQLWDCIASWMVRLAAVVEREWPQLTKTSIEIRLELPNVVNWERPDKRDVMIGTEDLSIAIVENSSLIVLTIPQGFMKMFSTPKNIAEQRIITAILEGVTTLAKIPFNAAQGLKYTHDIIGNEDARFFHVVTVTSLEQILAGLYRPKPLLIKEEDFAFAHQGVADLVGRPEKAADIHGLAACRKFLEDLVTKVWERIETRLKSFERTSVVQRCFQALDEIARDEEHWDMTTRSELALHAEKENVYEVLFTRRSDRASASVGNRLIIETAQYACAAEAGLTLSEADHSTVLAEMVLLLLLSNHRDAISHGFIDPKVEIAPNGEVEVNEDFYRDVMSRYFSKMGRDASDQAAAEYEIYFPETQDLPESGPMEADAFVEEFDKVFFPEYGFSIHQLFKVKAEFRSLAISSQKSGGSMSEELMIRFLAVCGLAQEEAEAFLTCFTLPIRSAWNKNLPARCSERDVYPWKHRRQLSLLSRPIVQESVSPRRWLLSMPVFERCVGYWLNCLEKARFPRSYFKSIEMQGYFDTVIDQSGYKFAKQVQTLFSDAGYSTKLEMEMTQLGASKNLRLGDVDVLAWEKTSGRVYAIECKRLLVAHSVGEVVQRLEDFRGNKNELDSLGRHLRRIDWLSENLEAVSKFTQIPKPIIQLLPLLVTSEIVPMQFYDGTDFPTSQVIIYEDLAKILRRSA